MTGGGKGRSRSRLLSIVLGVICLAVALSIMFSMRSEKSATAPDTDDAPAPPVAVAPPVAPRPERAPPPAPPPPVEEEVVTSDGLPIMPASPDARRPEGPVHPHPITPQHQRIFAENRLVGSLNGAMDVKDVAGMRRLLEQYRREYPDDPNVLQDGYAMIADCFEHPGAASRAAAERWVVSNNGSILKRFVNRHCLEPQQ